MGDHGLQLSLVIEMNVSSGLFFEDNIVRPSLYNRGGRDKRYLGIPAKIGQIGSAAATHSGFDLHQGLPFIGPA